MFNTLHINNLNRKTSLPCQANESKYEVPSSERAAACLHDQEACIAVLSPPLQRRYLDVHTCT